MCRWLAYSGSPVSLADLLYGSEHSLIVQSLHAQLGNEETNGDGFGVAWYDHEDGPAVFRGIEPAWNDRNLADLSKHIRSGLVFAHVRASTHAPVQLSNRRSSPGLACRRPTCSAMRALTPLPVGLRSIWRPAKMQTLRLGDTRPSVRMVP